MFVRLYEVFLGSPKWFQFGLCPLAYAVVGILVSHLFNLKRTANKKIGCGDFTSAGTGWGAQGHCPKSGLCSSHDTADTVYSVFTVLSIPLWPLMITLMVTCIFIVKSFSFLSKVFMWFWNLPARNHQRKWGKVSRLLELLGEKYEYAPIELKSSKQRKDILLFNVTYQDKTVVGAYRLDKGFVINATIDRSTPDCDVFYEDNVVFLPEVQGAYCKIREMLQKK
jgi:hypothetical protein